MGYKLFDKNITPACEYCEHGLLTSDGAMVDCVKRGLVSPYFRCPRFKYSPVLRIPRRSPKLPKYEKDDFSL
ncbi:MAG: hypothetical protein Q4B42_03415 [Oscillospiraceae bacterium]|nr:hypothetical protein [Oscillospiraceae bacterium]